MPDNQSQDRYQAPDASDSLNEQADNIPEENLVAPIEKVPSPPPKIPAKDRKRAQQAKNDLKSGEGDT